MATIESRMIETGGRPSGFDYLRIILSVAVIAFHSVELSYGDDFTSKFYQLPGISALHLLILPMFFSLSGFLVAGSLSRSKTIFIFLGLRVIRIYPALIMEVLLSAFILGPFFTSMSIGNYFKDHLFFRYLVNVTGHVSFFLPGVFSSNPVPNTVNAQLWTVPFELYCYLALTLCLLLRLIKARFVMVTALAMFVLAKTAKVIWKGEMLSHDYVLWHLSGDLLLAAFFSGILLYLFREKLAWNLATGVMSAFCALIFFSIPVTMNLGVIASAYFTIYVGLLNPRKLSVIKGADYSYGLYLYGFPIQQALIATGPWARNWAINLVTSLVIASFFAAFSWHCVEKPATGLRSKLKKWEKHWIRLFSSRTSAVDEGPAQQQSGKTI